MLADSLTEPVKVLTKDVRRLAGSFAFHARDRGVVYAVGDTVDFLWAQATYPLMTVGEPATFEFDGRTMTYVRSRHNRAWRNERAVELALGLDFLARRPATRTLEVGNVMAHYTARDHVVVDKYEVAPNVINVDIVDYSSAAPFETILSLSTLEHIGWDERPRESDKTMRACERMRSLLAPGGELLLTCPVGQNEFLDRYIVEETLPFDDRRYLRRVDRRNRWEECGLDDVRGARYGSPFRNANALFVGRMLPSADAAPSASIA